MARASRPSFWARTPRLRLSSRRWTWWHSVKRASPECVGWPAPAVCRMLRAMGRSDKVCAGHEHLYPGGPRSSLGRAARSVLRGLPAHDILPRRRGPGAALGSRGCSARSRIIRGVRRVVRSAWPDRHAVLYRLAAERGGGGGPGAAATLEPGWGRSLVSERRVAGGRLSRGPL